MVDSTKLGRTKILALRKEQTLARMKASRHADAPCFVYLFALAEVAKIKVGISIDPLKRIRDMPQEHLRFDDVFDLRRSFAVFVPRRADAMALERAALKHFFDCATPAPSSSVSYVSGAPVCASPIRWSAGGKREWLNAHVYDELKHFLLFADRRSSRPAISISDWEIALTEGLLQ